jgi:hypothetical protein
MRHLFGLRNHKLTAAALLSLLLMVPLIGSFLFATQVLYGRRSVAGSGGYEHVVSIDFELSRVGFWSDRSVGEPIRIQIDALQLGPLCLWIQWFPVDEQVFWNQFWDWGYRSKRSTFANIPVAETTFTFSAAIPLPLCLIAPTLWLRRRRKQRRRKKTDCCPTCGYDLRATLDASAGLLPRCPECGTNFSAWRSREKGEASCDEGPPVADNNGDEC